MEVVKIFKLSNLWINNVPQPFWVGDEHPTYAPAGAWLPLLYQPFTTCRGCSTDKTHFIFISEQ